MEYNTNLLNYFKEITKHTNIDGDAWVHTKTEKKNTHRKQLICLILIQHMTNYLKNH